MIKNITRTTSNAEILEWIIDWENKIFKTKNKIRKIKLLLFHDVPYGFFEKISDTEILLEDAPETYWNWDQERIKAIYEY